MRHHGYIAVESCGGDGYEAVLGVAGRVQIIEHSGVTNVHRAAHSGVALDCFGYSGSHSSGDLAVVGLVTSHVVHGDGYRHAQPLTVGGVAGGTVASHQLQTVDGHLDVHHVAGDKGRRQGGAVDLSGRGEELQLNDLVGGAYANYAQVANLSVLEELVYTVIAQERNASLGNCGSAYTNQLLVVIQGGDGGGGVEGEPSYGNVFVGFHKHVDGAEVSQVGVSSTASLLIDVNTGSSGCYPASPEGESCHVITGRTLFFS